jgi:hypothetical protein
MVVELRPIEKTPIAFGFLGCSCFQKPRVGFLIQMKLLSVSPRNTKFLKTHLRCMLEKNSLNLRCGSESSQGEPRADANRITCSNNIHVYNSSIASAIQTGNPTG